MVGGRRGGPGLRGGSRRRCVVYMINHMLSLPSPQVFDVMLSVLKIMCYAPAIGIHTRGLLRSTVQSMLFSGAEPRQDTSVSESTVDNAGALIGHFGLRTSSLELSPPMPSPYPDDKPVSTPPSLYSSLHSTRHVESTRPDRAGSCPAYHFHPPDLRPQRLQTRGRRHLLHHSQTECNHRGPAACGLPHAQTAEVE